MSIDEIGDGPEEDAVKEENHKKTPYEHKGCGHDGFGEGHSITCIQDVIREFGRLTERFKFYYHESWDLFHWFGTYFGFDLL